MAFIQKTTTPLAFQGGLQSKTDALQLQHPSLLELQNAMFSKVGQLNKRFGYNELTKNTLNGGSINNAFAIDSFNNELNLFDNNNIYTYLSSNGNWANRGTAISLINSNEQIIRSTTSQQLNPDCAVLAGMELYVWEDTRTGGARYSIIDSTTKSYAVADQPLYGYRPKIVINNNLFYVFTTDGLYNLNCRTINPLNPSIISGITNLYADGYTGTTYDIIADGTGFDYMYYADNSNLYIKKLDINFNVLHTVNFTPDVITAASLFLDSTGQLWCTWANDIGLGTVILDHTSYAVTIIGTPDKTPNIQTITAVEYSTPGQIQYVFECPSTTGNASDQLVKSVIITNIGGLTLAGTLRSVGLATKAFNYKGNILVNVTHQSTLQSTYFTVLLQNNVFTIIGKISAQVGGGLVTNNLLGNVNQPQPGVFIWANLVKGQYLTADNIGFSLLGVNSTTTDFTDVNKFNSVTQSNNLLFVGGILQSYDGVAAAEQNFHIFPENITYTVIPGAGLLSVGQYEYQIVYAWSDKFGQIQYSSPSQPIIVSCPVVDSAVLLNIDTCRLTSKTNISIRIYRTQVNQPNLFEITNPLAPLHNNPNVDRVIFDDALADSEIASNALIYTTGGILPNAAPPSCSFISLYQNRVMLAGLEDKNLIWFSKNKFNNTNFNTIAVEFSALNTIGVDPRGGPIGALGLMDSNLIIFKDNAIFLLNGDGPDDTGNGSFPDPEIISSNLGCSNPDSLLLAKEGLYFQSAKGIWLLDRSFGLTYVGQGVDDYNDFTVSSATLDPNDNLIYFTTSQGPTLVYDYFLGQWSTWTGANNSVIDSCVFENLLTMVKANGQVFQQNRNGFMDGVNPIVMEVILPWMSWAGMQGWQRVFRATILGNYRGPHILNVSVGYDNNPSFLQSVTIPATTIAGSNVWGADNADGYADGYVDGYWGSSNVWGGIFQPYVFQVNFQNQTCTSLRLKISDSPTSPYNEGYTLNNISFEVGILGDNRRLPASNKFGTGSNS